MISNKKQNFERIASKRVAKIDEQLRLLGNLENRSFYEFSRQDIDKLSSHLENSLKTALKRLKQGIRH